MKKILLIIYLFSISQLLNAQKVYKINVNLPNELAKSQITLKIKDDIGKDILDTKTATVINGKSLFTGTLTEPSKNAVIEVRKGAKKYTAEFVLDTGYHTVDITIKNEIHGSLGTIIKNSVSNQIKFKFDSLSRSQYDLYKKSKNITSYNALPEQEEHQLNLAYLKLISEYPNDYYSLMQLNLVAHFISMYDQRMLIVNTYKKLTSTLQEDPLGLEIIAKIDRRVISKKASSTGQKIFDFDIKNYDGSTYSSINLNNKTYVIAFSANWCVPCQESLPKLKNLYNKYKDKGLEVLYYNQDTNFQEWEDSMKKQNLNWINLNEIKSINRLGSKLAITYVPSYILIDKKGIITFNSQEAGVGIDELEKHIEEVLN